MDCVQTDARHGEFLHVYFALARFVGERGGRQSVSQSASQSGGVTSFAKTLVARCSPLCRHASPSWALMSTSPSREKHDTSASEKLTDKDDMLQAYRNIHAIAPAGRLAEQPTRSVVTSASALRPDSFVEMLASKQAFLP